MDKYNGINRPQTSCKDIVYKTMERGLYKSAAAKTKIQQHKKNGGITIIMARCIICIILLCVCAIGKYTDYKPLNQASAYIKTQLSQDFVQGSL